VSPDELRRLYSSCGILLADHWDDMRARGFVANRLYDALACEAFVLCEHVEGIDAELGDAVDTYRHSADLRAKVQHWLAHPDARRERARRGRELVLERHTVDDRARQLLAAIERVRRQDNARGALEPAGVTPDS
jgi:spore maturation protein CgeB